MLEGGDSVRMQDIWLESRDMTKGMRPVPEAVQRWHEGGERADQAYEEQELARRQTPEWEEKERKRLRGVLIYFGGKRP